MDTGKLKVAVVGCGIGKSHVSSWQAIPEHFEMRIICDIDETKARELATTSNIPVAVTDFDALCQRDDVDIIDVCTPPHLHFRMIMQALAAGKHVVCEKPLVGCLREVDELAVAEREAGKRVMPIFQYRWGHGLQKLKHLIALGLAGKTYLTTVETSWRRRAPYYAVPWRGKWKTELGGCLLGHAIHNHDILNYVGGPVRSLFARTATRVNPIETEDCAAISLEMADGSLATSGVTLGSSEEITRHRFSFAGFVAESNTRPYTNSGDPWKFIGDTSELQKQIDEALAQFQPRPESYHGQFLRFAEALRDGTALPVELADARRSLELISAMYYSSATQQPVTLPIEKEHPTYNSWVPSNWK
jgi:predicted dehydrogenase